MADNDAIWKTPLAVSRCPSDTVGTDSNGYPRNSYVACFSADGTMIAPGNNCTVDSCNNNATKNPSVSSGKRALFNANVARTIAEVSDGTSNTVALSETISGPNGSNDQRGLWCVDWGCQYTHNRTPNSTLADQVWSVAAGTPLNYCVPDKAPCDGTAGCWSTENYAARSLHPGGVNVLYVDGSLHFIPDSIDYQVWQNMASINSGEILTTTF